MVTGDPSQVDLPPGQKSGLIEASRILTNVEGIARLVFRDVDVVRHDLVRRIVTAYDQDAAAAVAAAATACREGRQP
jgi:phosphate starvation-inducible PhoH-like protein